MKYSVRLQASESYGATSKHKPYF